MYHNVTFLDSSLLPLLKATIPILFNYFLSTSCLWYLESSIIPVFVVPFPILTSHSLNHVLPHCMYHTSIPFQLILSFYFQSNVAILTFHSPLLFPIPILLSLSFYHVLHFFQWLIWLLSLYIPINISTSILPPRLICWSPLISIISLPTVLCSPILQDYHVTSISMYHILLPFKSLISLLSVLWSPITDSINPVFTTKTTYPYTSIHASQFTALAGPHSSF